MDWPLLWAGLLALIVLLYVILDGFDLGIGILSPFFKPHEKQQLMDSIAPVWDGNETWLVLGGGVLFAAFPLAYAIILPAIYPLLIWMLLGLIFRGVAFEYTHRTHTKQHWWYFSFFIGSLIATFAQGMILGTLLQGIKNDGHAYIGGWWDWLTPFTLFCGLALTISYSLLGATWGMIKTYVPLSTQCTDIAKKLMIGFIICIGLVSVWLPFKTPQIFQRWLEWQNSGFFFLIPILSFISTLLLCRALKNKAALSAYLLTLSLFIFSFFGFSVSLYPYLVPFSLTLWETASPQNSLQFLFIGVAVLLPIILSYTAYNYWVFRGKIPPISPKLKPPKK
jgi:cytochrome d ubiquinol oxidase subunit II